MMYKKIAIVVFTIIAIVSIELSAYHTTTSYLRRGAGTSLIEEVKNAVVIVSGTDDNQRLGTGFFIDDNVILTNAHITAGDYEFYNVGFDHSPEPYKAIVKYEDMSIDLAVLELVEWDKFVAENEDLRYLNLSEDYGIAQRVYAVGHPWGLLYSVSTGIVSHEARKVPLDTSPRFFIQTDTAVFEGNSGGPLVNLDGEVLGINTMIFSGSGNGLYAFAIPAVLINKSLSDFNKYGEVRWTSLGLAFSGNLITAIIPDSPAEKAGLQVNDVMLGVTIDREYTEATTIYDILYAIAKSDYNDDMLITIKDSEGDAIELTIDPTYKTAKDFVKDEPDPSPFVPRRSE